MGIGRLTSTVLVTDAKFAEISVVKELSCIMSNNAYNKLTSDRTFCGNGTNGAGTCFGDSGEYEKSYQISLYPIEL